LTCYQWKSLVTAYTTHLSLENDDGVFKRLVQYTQLESLTIFDSDVANKALLRLGRALTKMKFVMYPSSPVPHPIAVRY
jgi:hypothetical protein